MVRKNEAGENLKQARRDLAKAEQQYAALCRTAERQLESAERAHDKAVVDAKKALEEAEREHDSAVNQAHWKAETARAGVVEVAYGDVRLYSTRLETPEGEVPLSSAIHATVEATGTKTEKTDTRETVLLLDTPAFDVVVRVNPKDTTRVRELAAKINTAAKNAQSRHEAHAQGLAAAEADHERVKSEQDAIEQARTQFEAAEADTRAVAEAERELERARASTTDLDAARTRLLELDPNANLRATEDLRRRGHAASVGAAWRRRSRKAKAAIVAAAVITALALIGALAGDPKEQTAQQGSPADGGDALTLEVTNPALRIFSASGATQAIRGRVSRGAQVTVNGDAVPVTSDRFAATVPLQYGENTLIVRATKPGETPKDITLSVTRDRPALDLRIESPSSSALTVRTPELRIEGVATKGAVVLLNSTRLRLRGIRFAATVGLRQGANTFTIKASKNGFEQSEAQLIVTRRLSPAEIAAKQARARAQFIAQSRTIPFNQLIKNPEAYAGVKVKYYGEILQIQESGGGGFMLLYVTHVGYGVWTNQIWVNYRGHVRGAQGDKLTVYGIVLGTKSYETQIGGETYVPEIEARYILE